MVDNDLLELSKRSYALPEAIYSGFLRRAGAYLENGETRDELTQIVEAVRDLETRWHRIWEAIHGKLVSQSKNEDLQFFETYDLYDIAWRFPDRSTARARVLDLISLRSDVHRELAELGPLISAVANDATPDAELERLLSNYARNTEGSIVVALEPAHSASANAVAMAALGGDPSEIDDAHA